MNNKTRKNKKIGKLIVIDYNSLNLKDLFILLLLNNSYKISISSS